jgi:hypothetical protein
MKTIKQLTDQILNSIQVEKNTAPADPAQLPLQIDTKPKIKRGKPVKQKAVFKLVIYFKEYKKQSASDQGKRNFYSYAESYNAGLQKIIKCEKTSLNKIYKLVRHTFADKYKTALIYHSNPPGFNKGAQINLVTKFNYDRMTSERRFDFTFINDSVKFVFLNND